jgi:ribosomal protein S18 acetylase RimI-like enzyme
VQIGALEASQRGEAVDVISRGMLDNPTHIAALGRHPGLRQRRIHRIFSRVLPVMSNSFLAATDSSGALLGVLGMAAPGRCKPSGKQRMQITLGLLPLGPSAVARSLQWVGTWERLDFAQPHWHLGPVAVDTHLQGMGIGSDLMTVFCAQMDAAAHDAYLETDKPENVRFYQRFGFEVLGEQEVIGVPNWFMVRRSKAQSQ